MPSSDTKEQAHGAGGQAPEEELWARLGFEGQMAALQAHRASLDPPLDPEVFERLSAVWIHRTWSHQNAQRPVLRSLLGLEDIRSIEPLLFDTSIPFLRGAPVFNKDRWTHLAEILVAWVNILPVGDPLLNHAPTFYRALCTFAPPEARLYVGRRGFGYVSAPEEGARLFQQFKGEARTVYEGEKCAQRKTHQGLTVLHETDEDFQTVTGYAHVHALSSKEELMHQIGPFLNAEGYRETTDWFRKIYAFFFDPQSLLHGIITRMQNTPVPVGEFEHNPLFSVPEIIAQATEKYGISADAAALYLLTLVHPDPQQKHVRALMGWKLATYRAACAELAQAKLLVEGKRWAGREHFLPGLWEKSTKRERWRALFYEAQDIIEYDAPMPWMIAPMFMVSLPWHLAFERAWARIQSGDVPRFEEAVW